MKPRIRKVFGVWECAGRSEYALRWIRGHGYTPQEAYRDWKAQQ